MPIEGTKVEIVKAALADLIKQATSRVWRPKTSKIGPLPADQKYAVVVLALNPAVVAGDHDALQTAIEGLAGVTKAIITHYGIGPAADEIPAGTDAKLFVEAGLTFAA